jgi:hypothetical protein
VKEMRKNIAGLEKYLKKGSKQSKEILAKYKTRLKAMEKETYVDDVDDEVQGMKKLTLGEETAELKVKQ